MDLRNYCISRLARLPELATLLRDMRRVAHARQQPGTAVRGQSLPDLPTSRDGWENSP
jgi:hypothetical protein